MTAPNRDCIETTTGLYYHFRAPRSCEIDIEDIATGLANECRFDGFVKRYYSVAEHALLVRELVIIEHPELGFEALHHDSHEAYLKDIPKPLKNELGPRYDSLCHKADVAIGLAFDIDHRLFDDPIIKAADRLATQMEARELKRSGGRGPHWESYWEEWGLSMDPPYAPWHLGIMPPDDAARSFTWAHIHERTNRITRRTVTHAAAA